MVVCSTVAVPATTSSPTPPTSVSTAWSTTTCPETWTPSARRLGLFTVRPDSSASPAAATVTVGEVDPAEPVSVVPAGDPSIVTCFSTTRLPANVPGPTETVSPGPARATACPTVRQGRSAEQLPSSRPRRDTKRTVLPVADPEEGEDPV